MEQSFCVTVYETNHRKSSDDGTYRPSEHNNDDTLYRFGYKVNAIETGDIKQHVETRSKDDVKGEYFVIEPNGVSRLVQYIANANGFNAVVRHQFGTKYSKNSSTNNFTRSDPYHQEHHTNLFDTKINNPEHLPQDRFLPMQSNKYLRQQNSKYRQSSPKSITNQSSIRLLESSMDELAKMPQTTDIPTKQIIGRRRQYEVNDPEVDIDIRRSIQKPFLNLAKLKQPRNENNE